MEFSITRQTERNICNTRSLFLLENFNILVSYYFSFAVLDYKLLLQARVHDIVHDFSIPYFTWKHQNCSQYISRNLELSLFVFSNTKLNDKMTV